MMPNGENRRLLKYPILLAQCGTEASFYAKCIIEQEDVHKSVCEKEFRLLKQCLQKRAKELGTRL